MAIEPRRDWGETVLLAATPTDCGGDRRLAGAASGAVVRLTEGNLWRALGRPTLASAGTVVRIVPLDGLTATLRRRDGTVQTWPVADRACVRPPLWRGGPLRGGWTLVSNSGILRGRNLLPRAHPNDGRVDVLEVRSMTLRQRFLSWHRALRGDHLPHPGLAVSQTRSIELAVGPGRVLTLDGRRRRCESCVITVVPDCWTAAIPVPNVASMEGQT